MSRPDSFLRNAMRADAAFGALAGADLVLFSGPLARLLGIEQSGTLVVVGAGLLAYAAWLFAASRRDPLSTTEVWTFVGADFAWIAGSVVLIAMGAFGAPGNWIVGIAAAAVLAFAEAKILGVRRLRRGAGGLALGRQTA